VRLTGYPRLSDPVCPLEVGEHEDMEELGTRSGTEGAFRRSRSRRSRSSGLMTAGYAVVPASRAMRGLLPPAN
jgi:hypothetical protein